MLLILLSCSKTEIINAPIPRDNDTVVVKSYKEYNIYKSDTTHIDTTRIPIGFSPSVEDWED